MTTAATLPGAMIQTVSALDGHAEEVTLDLSGLAFLDVAGARSLVAAVQAIPDGHPVTIRSISPIARRVLRMLDCDLATVRPTAGSG